MAIRKLLVATSNPGKLAEFRRLLPGAELVSLEDAGVSEEPEETGRSFGENALIKARHAHSQTGMAVLADDSGLEVEGLDGEPGVRSARYAGEGASQEQLISYLLKKLEGVEGAGRNARFRCALVLLVPGVMPQVFQGSCEGVITQAPRGEHGFGYDPIFQMPDGRTMAELEPEEKVLVSHRAEAAALLRASGMLEQHELVAE